MTNFEKRVKFYFCQISFLISIIQLSNCAYGLFQIFSQTILEEGTLIVCL